MVGLLIADRPGHGYLRHRPLTLNRRSRAASSPIITANWDAASGQKWTVPLGGGGGRAFRLGKQAMNFQVQAFELVERPHYAGDWIFRAQFQLLFPK